MAKQPQQGAVKKKIEIPDTPITKASMDSIKTFMIVSIAGTTLAVLLGGYFIYTLAQSNIRKALEVRAQEYQISLTEKKLKNLEEAEPMLAEVKKSENGSVSKFDKVTRRSLPETESFEDILTIFNTLQTNERVSVESIARPATLGGAATAATGAPTQGGKAVPGAVSIKVTGKRDAMISFLKAIERSARIFDFSSLKISSSTGDLSLDMDYKVYSMPKPSIVNKEVDIQEYEKDKGSYEK